MHQFRYRLKKRSLRRAREEFATARYAAATTHHTTQASKQPYSFAHGRCGLFAVVCSTRLAELGVAAAAAGVDGTAAPTISLLSASDDMAARQIAVREAARHAFAGYVPRCPQCPGSDRVPHVHCIVCHLQLPRICVRQRLVGSRFHCASQRCGWYGAHDR